MARGGKRAGAGRPRGTGKYHEPTKLARIPTRLAERIARTAGQGYQPLVSADAEVAEALTVLEQGLSKAQNQTSIPIETAVAEIQRGLDLIKQALGVEALREIPTAQSQPQQEQPSIEAHLTYSYPTHKERLLTPCVPSVIPLPQRSLPPVYRRSVG